MKHGDKVIVSATVGRSSNHHTGAKLVLVDVVVDGSYFIGHTWVKMNSRLEGVKLGDKISFTARIKEYMGYELECKFGLEHIRNVVISSES